MLPNETDATGSKYVTAEVLMRPPARPLNRRQRRAAMKRLGIFKRPRTR